METPQQQTQSPEIEGMGPIDPVDRAKAHLIEQVMHPGIDNRTKTLAASGLMNYYLAAEIGGLIQMLMHALTVPQEEGHDGNGLRGDEG